MLSGADKSEPDGHYIIQLLLRCTGVRGDFWTRSSRFWPFARWAWVVRTHQKPDTRASGAVSGAARVAAVGGVVGGCGSSCRVRFWLLCPRPASGRGRVWRPLCVPARLLPACRWRALSCRCKNTNSRAYFKPSFLAANLYFNFSSFCTHLCGFVSQLVASRFWKIISRPFFLSSSSMICVLFLSLYNNNGDLRIESASPTALAHAWICAFPVRVWAHWLF